jgi:hypothetical protein
LEVEVLEGKSWRGSPLYQLDGGEGLAQRKGTSSRAAQEFAGAAFVRLILKRAQGHNPFHKDRSLRARFKRTGRPSISGLAEIGIKFAQIG